MKPKPKYVHDCKKCKFLGHVSINGERADIYVCEREERRQSELIWRHSNDPGDYGWSWPTMCTPLSEWAMVALSLYVNHLGANGASTTIKGTFYKDNELVLDLDPQKP